MLKFVSTSAFSLALSALPALALATPSIAARFDEQSAGVNVACGTRLGTYGGLSIKADTYAEADGIDAYDATGAADFTVQQGCTVTEVDVQGRYFNRGGPATAVDVTFYTNDAIRNVPRTVVRSFMGMRFVDPGGKGSLEIPIPPTTFKRGTYWVAVSVHIDANVGGVWGWDLQEEQQGLPAMLKQNGGYGPNCVDFGPLLQCFKIRGEYIFVLLGTGQ